MESVGRDLISYPARTSPRSPWENEKNGYLMHFISTKRSSSNSKWRRGINVLCTFSSFADIEVYIPLTQQFMCDEINTYLRTESRS